MCKNQRATFSKVLIEDDGKIETFYTTSVKRKTTWYTAAGIVVAMIVGMLTIRGAVISGVRGVAKEEFKEELGIFHAIAKPTIEKSVDTKIELHRTSGVHPGAFTELQAAEQISAVKSKIMENGTMIGVLVEGEKHQTLILEELLRKAGP